MIHAEHAIDALCIRRGEDHVARISKFTVRTSGRRVFRRCLRKWGFQSSMRMNLQRKGTEQNINFWFGSAIHFAMEDYFGYNRFGDPVKAFQAYYAAFPTEERPLGADEHYYLGMGMLNYFKEWYARHNADPQFQTVWLDENNNEVAPGTEGARPLVEESFMLDLGIKVWVREDTEEIINIKKVELHEESPGRYYFLETPDLTEGLVLEPKKVYVSEVPVYYHGTMDRIVKDKKGRWWIMDWKTAKSADTNKLETDDQISAYMWAGEQWLGHPIHGFVYVQLTKDLPKPPRRLANGNISVDKKQKTTYALAKAEIIKDYGEVRKAPAKYIDFLNYLASLETPEGDRFIRWDFVLRNKAQKEATYRHILGEVSLMVDPDLYLFPNPTRDCIWDCPFRDACLLIDQGKEEEAMAWLEAEFEQRPREEDGNIEPWRERIPWPETGSNAIGTLVEEMSYGADETLNIILPDKYKDILTD